MRSTRPREVVLLPEGERLLDSWKEISSYMGRAARTVQRWETEEGLPVHRHQHAKAGTVFAYASEIDAWREGRDDLVESEADETRQRNWLRLALPVGAVVVVGALGWWLLDRRAPDPEPGEPAFAFEQRDWLLIADFDNRTGEELLDGTLEAALRRELSNSTFMNVASAGRVDDALQLTGRPLDTKGDRALAQELALRDGGIRAILAGRVERLGSAYLLSVEVLNPLDGVVLTSLSEEADGQDKILAAVSSLSRRVRASLGETLPTLAPGQTDLLKVSTSSLRALQLYTQADQLKWEGMLDATEKLLREAIVEDPEFASAYTLLAWTLRYQDRLPEEYLSYAGKALELADGATVVERHYIRGSYHQLRSLSTQRDADGEAALAQYRALLELDPGHFWAANNAAGTLDDLGRGRETLDLFLRLLDARPNDVGLVSRVAIALVEIEGDLETARAYVHRAEKLQGDLPIRNSRWQPFLEFFPVHELWVRGQTEGVVQELDKMMDSLPDRAADEREDLVFYAQELYLDLGMFSEAEGLQEAYGGYTPSGWEGKMAARRKDWDYVTQRARERGDSSSPAAQSMGAFALARLGLVQKAEEILGEIPDEIGLSAKRYALAAQGFVDVARRRYEEAIPELEEALDLLRYHGVLAYYFEIAKMLSRAWWEVGQPERALEVLEEASEQRPRLLAAHRNYWMEVQLRLAELYRQLGREQEALEIEDELRRYSAYADPDFPILQELERRQRLAPAALG